MEINLSYRDRYEKGVKINKCVHLEWSVDEFDSIKLRSNKINYVYSCARHIIMRHTILFCLYCTIYNSFLCKTNYIKPSILRLNMY